MADHKELDTKLTQKVFLPPWVSLVPVLLSRRWIEVIKYILLLFRRQNRLCFYFLEEKDSRRQTEEACALDFHLECLRLIQDFVFSDLN